MNTDLKPSEKNESLKSFLQKEIKETEEKLSQLRAQISEAESRGLRARLRKLFRFKSKLDDLKSLEIELEKIKKTLDSYAEEDTRLFLLRRELTALREEVDALVTKPSWRLPARAWVAIVIVPILIYFAILSALQWQNQDIIYNYDATLTATAQQAAPPVAVTTPVPSFTPTP